MTFNSHNIVSGQSGPFVLINVCMYELVLGLKNFQLVKNMPFYHEVKMTYRRVTLTVSDGPPPPRRSDTGGQNICNLIRRMTANGK